MIKLVLSTLLYASVLSIAEAKCATSDYTVGGTVSNDSGELVPNAHIVIGWSELDGYANRKVSADTDETGHYIVHIRFYPWSGGGSEGDKCSATLTTVKIQVVAESFDPIFEDISIIGSATTANQRFKPTGHKKP